MLVLVPYIHYIRNYLDENIELTSSPYISYKLLVILLLQTFHVVALFLSWDGGFLWCALQASNSTLIILMPILGLLNSVPLDVWVSSVGSHTLLIVDYVLHLFIASNRQSNYWTAKVIGVVLTCLWCTLGLFSFNWAWKVCLFLTMTVWSGSQLLMGSGIRVLITRYKQSRRK